MKLFGLLLIAIGVILVFVLSDIFDKRMEEKTYEDLKESIKQRFLNLDLTSIKDMRLLGVIERIKNEIQLFIVEKGKFSIALNCPEDLRLFLKYYIESNYSDLKVCRISERDTDVDGYPCADCYWGIALKNR